MVLILVGLVLGKRAERGAIRLLKRSARFCRGLVTQRGMRPDVVIIVAPEGQRSAGIGEAVEYFLIEAFVSQTTVEAFNVTILLGLARIDVVPFDAIVVGPLQDSPAGELGTIACWE